MDYVTLIFKCLLLLTFDYDVDSHIYVLFNYITLVDDMVCLRQDNICVETFFKSIRVIKSRFAELSSMRKL